MLHTCIHTYVSITYLARPHADGAQRHHHGERDNVELALAEGEDGGELRFLLACMYVSYLLGGGWWVNNLIRVSNLRLQRP